MPDGRVADLALGEARRVLDTFGPGALATFDEAHVADDPGRRLARR
jgi:hypothetical protein